MSKKRDSSHVNIWKHRIKGLLQKNSSLNDPTSPPPSPTSSIYTKSKPSSLIYRMFATRNKSKTIIQLKKHQWDGDLTQEDTISDLPIRANLMTIFSATQNGGENWDDMSRLYMTTLQKLRLLNHYSMEHQLVIHNILNQIQDTSSHNTIRNRNSLLHRDFSSLISGQLMGNRKPRRTRYIFMLLSTPASLVAHRVHPVTDALHKLRKPYAETMLVMYPHHEQDEAEDKVEEEKHSVMMYRFIPEADYLLDPVTLRANFYQQQEQEQEEHRLGTKFSGNTTTTTTTTATAATTGEQSHQLKELMAAM